MTVKYIGHATSVVTIGGKRVVTDPNFARQLKFVVWRHGRRPTLDDVGSIDFMLVSHAHFDHLDRPTLRRFPRSTPVVCSVGCSDLFRKDGFQEVHELPLWKSVTVGGLKITAVPSKHFEARIIFDRHRWYGGFVVEAVKESFYFPGDTGYFDGFKLIAKKFKSLTLALLPIGSYKPERWLRPVHMGPEDALQAFEELKAKWMVPIHWGIFRLGLDRVREPFDDLRRLAALHPKGKQILFLNTFEQSVL